MESTGNVQVRLTANRRHHETDALSQIDAGKEHIYCPTGCGRELVGRGCKLWCPNCGPVIACSDY